MKKRLSTLLLLSALALLATSATASASKTSFFQTRSGNIACAVFKQGVRCDIAKHKWHVNPHHHGCSLDYGNGAQVRRHGKGGFTCAGDTQIGIGTKLDPGASVSVGQFTCKVKPKGLVRCVNHENGHGFRLSRRSYKFF